MTLPSKRKRTSSTPPAPLTTPPPLTTLPPPATPPALVTAIFASTSTLSATPVTAVTSCPIPAKKHKKTGLVINRNGGRFELSGRPDFATVATKIKVADKQDRRHVLGYDDVIRPAFEQAVNGYLAIAGHDEAGLRALLATLNAKYKLRGPPKTKTATEDHLRYALTQLNSAPGNLNPEAASENQAIEHVRQAAVHAGARLDAAFKSPDELLADGEAVAKTRSILLDGFKHTDGDTPITKHADMVRAVVRDRLDQATTVKEMLDILHETKTSTGIDLSKREGAKVQTSYSLALRHKIDTATNPQEKLEALYEILATPREPA